MKQDKNQKTVEAYNKNPQFYADRFDKYKSSLYDIDNALRLNKSGSDKILELGCANGRDAKIIVSRVGKDNYIGLDASKELIKIAEDKNPDIVFHVKDMREELGFPDDFFGIVFAFHSFLHLPPKKEGKGIEYSGMSDLLKKCHKILKIGGILYISGKYGKYKEIELKNLGDLKYYYSYEPEDVIKLAGKNFKPVYRVIRDSDYGPCFVVALEKTN